MSVISKCIVMFVPMPVSFGILFQTLRVGTQATIFYSSKYDYCLSSCGEQVDSITALRACLPTACCLGRTSGALPLALERRRNLVIAFGSSGSYIISVSKSAYSSRCEGRRKRRNRTMATPLVTEPTDEPTDEPEFYFPIRSYDVHVYFWQTDPANTALAMALRNEAIEAFPDLKIYKYWDVPVGPHPIGMFEVDIKNREQFSRFIPWIQVNRRGLSVLVHPNTGRPLNDHTVHAMWIGHKVVLNTNKLSNDLDDYGYASHGLKAPVQ